MAAPVPPSPNDDKPSFDLNLQHGHKDLVQAVAFNTYGDRCATGSVDGKVRVFNRHKDGSWRLCDTWGAHGGEVLELQWLPSTVYPNLIASLGVEGTFRLWAEDPSAAPGRRFCNGSRGRPAFEMRSPKFPFRSFSVKHAEDARQTFLALLATDGRLAIYENDQPENLTEMAIVDEFAVCPRPARGEEVSFRVRFDPNPEPCYAALRAGVDPESMGLVVAGMDTVRVYRSRDKADVNIGVATTSREFYLAAEISGHRGLVRDVAWAPGNIRGYDIIATACQDGYARVFRIDTPMSSKDAAARSWSVATVVKSEGGGGGSGGGHGGGHHRDSTATRGSSGGGGGGGSQEKHQHPSSLSASLAKSGANGDRPRGHLPDQIKHTYREISRVDSHRTPIWRVGFDDDGQILGTTGDDGKLLCYRQTPDGSWVKSSELAMMKTRMVAP